MRQKGKALLAVVLALILVITLGVMALADDYSSHWSAQYINNAFSRGWMTGDGSGNFRPEAAITRGEFAVMLWRALGQPEPQRQCPFADVSAGAFYYKAVAALFEKGVVNGLDSATYAPNVTLTREMGCTMLARAYNLSAVNANAYQQFADAATVSEWARAAVSALLEKNYVAGVGDNKLAPKQQLKRGEMAKLLITVADGAATAAAAAQQNAMAALTAYISGPAITLKQDVLGSDEVLVTVTATDSWDITFVGWRHSEKDATYKSKSGFTQLSGDMEFTVYENGWYAVYAENKNGYGSFKLFEVTTILEDAPKVRLSQKVLASGLVEIAVAVTRAGVGSDYEIDYIRYRTAKEGDTFSSSGSFTKDILYNKFEIDPEKDYGWYAVCAVDKRGKFGYRLIEVKKPNANYTVTFDADGGSPAPARQTISFNQKASKPADPAKTGFVFDGWYNGSAEWDFDDAVTKDLTLKAKWVDDTTRYTVSFDARGGSAVSQITNVPHGTKIAAPAAPTKGADTFAGWYKEEACVNAWNFTSDTVRSSLTLYAKWTPAPVAPGITTSTLPDGAVGTAYSQTLEASGDEPITWSLESGDNLPDGLNLSEGGVISGTPSLAGTFNFTVKATNSAGSDTKTLSITVI